MFGINTFLGTILKTIISLIFADKRGLALDVHSQVKCNTSEGYAGVIHNTGKNYILRLTCRVLYIKMSYDKARYRV